MIPGAAIAHGVLARVEFCAARLAHRGRKISLIESESTLCHGIEMRSLRILSSVERQVVVGAIVSNDEYDVGCRMHSTREEE
jgi:hypothetical protein